MGLGRVQMPETNSSPLPGGRVPKRNDHLPTPVFHVLTRKKSVVERKSTAESKGAGISHGFITKKLASAWSPSNLPLLFVTGSPKVRSRSCHGKLSGSNVEIGGNFVAQMAGDKMFTPLPVKNRDPRMAIGSRFFLVRHGYTMWVADALSSRA